MTKVRNVDDLRVRSRIRSAHLTKRVTAKQSELMDILYPSAVRGTIESESKFEPTRFVTQSQIRDQLPESTRAKLFEVRGTSGPYFASGSRNGRYVLAAGSLGTVEAFRRSVDGAQLKSLCSTSCSERVSSVTFLHNQLFFAAAQASGVRIYDTGAGKELHCLQDQGVVTGLDYLPYHVLLASSNTSGIVHWLDTSIGKPVAKVFTGKGPVLASAFTTFQSNGLVVAGHGNGAVSLLAPAIDKPALVIRCHSGTVTAAATHGNHNAVTAGVDGRWKLWDIRRAESALATHYFSGPPLSSISVSQTGHVGLTNQRRCMIFAPDVFNSPKVKVPYMTHVDANEDLYRCTFLNFEDILMVGASSRLYTAFVPGSGSSSYDSHSLEDPFETKTSRRNKEVKQLLEKLPIQSITLPQMSDKIGAPSIEKRPPRGPTERKSYVNPETNKLVRVQRGFTPLDKPKPKRDREAGNGKV